MKLIILLHHKDTFLIGSHISRGKTQLMQHIYKNILCLDTDQIIDVLITLITPDRKVRVAQHHGVLLTKPVEQHVFIYIPSTKHLKLNKGNPLNSISFLSHCAGIGCAWALLNFLCLVTNSLQIPNFPYHFSNNSSRLLHPPPPFFPMFSLIFPFSFLLTRPKYSIWISCVTLRFTTLYLLATTWDSILPPHFFLIPQHNTNISQQYSHQKYQGGPTLQDSASMAWSRSP